MAKASGQGYLEQAKNLAGSALAGAQAYLPNTNTNSTNANGSSTLSQIQAGAATALATGKEYLASAQAAAQPHVERVVEN